MSALQSVKTMNGVIIDAIRLNCSISRGLTEYLRYSPDLIPPGFLAQNVRTYQLPNQPRMDNFPSSSPSFDGTQIGQFAFQTPSSEWRDLSGPRPAMHHNLLQQSPSILQAPPAYQPFSFPNTNTHNPAGRSHISGQTLPVTGSSSSSSSFMDPFVAPREQSSSLSPVYPTDTMTGPPYHY
jgi:hypothetical protein